MRIIRHGVEYKIECPNCACMWVMSRMDLQDEQSGHTRTTYGPVYTLRPAEDYRRNSIFARPRSRNPTTMFRILPQRGQRCG